MKTKKILFFSFITLASVSLIILLGFLFYIISCESDYKNKKACDFIENKYQEYWKTKTYDIPYYKDVPLKYIRYVVMAGNKYVTPRDIFDNKRIYKNSTVNLFAKMNFNVTCPKYVGCCGVGECAISPSILFSQGKNSREIRIIDKSIIEPCKWPLETRNVSNDAFFVGMTCGNYHNLEFYILKGKVIIDDYGYVSLEVYESIKK